MINKTFGIYFPPLRISLFFICHNHGLQDEILSQIQIINDQNHILQEGQMNDDNAGHLKFIMQTCSRSILECVTEKCIKNLNNDALNVIMHHFE